MSFAATRALDFPKFEILPRNVLSRARRQVKIVPKWQVQARLHL
jgi:hypothetical protein